MCGVVAAIGDAFILKFLFILKFSKSNSLLWRGVWTQQDFITGLIKGYAVLCIVTKIILQNGIETDQYPLD